MPYYVVVKRSTKSFIDNAKWLQERGITDSEYHAGGWEDNRTNTVLPHLRFVEFEDAVAFSLASGGALSESVPERVPIFIDVV